MLIISFANDSVFLSINFCAVFVPLGFPPSLALFLPPEPFLTPTGCMLLFGAGLTLVPALAAFPELVPAPAACPAACDFTPLSHESYLLGFLNFVFIALTAFGFFNSSNTFL